MIEQAYTSKPRLYIIHTDFLDNPEAFNRYFALMPQYRQEKISRCKLQEDKKRSMCAGILLKKACEDYGIDQTKGIITGKNGKPYFPGTESFHFNISHSGSRVICLISTNENGCDVEKVKDFHSSVLNRVYNDNEIEWLNSFADESERKKAFFRLWTIKESYLKLLGTGFSMSAKSVMLDIDADNTIRLSKKTEQQCSIFELFIEDGYFYSCCLKKEEKPETVFWVEV